MVSCLTTTKSRLPPRNASKDKKEMIVSTGGVSRIQDCETASVTLSTLGIDSLRIDECHRSHSGRVPPPATRTAPTQSREHRPVSIGGIHNPVQSHCETAHTMSRRTQQQQQQQQQQSSGGDPIEGKTGIFSSNSSRRLHLPGTTQRIPHNSRPTPSSSSSSQMPLARRDEQKDVGRATQRGNDHSNSNTMPATSTTAPNRSRTRKGSRGAQRRESRNKKQAGTRQKPAKSGSGSTRMDPSKPTNDSLLSTTSCETTESRWTNPLDLSLDYSLATVAANNTTRTPWTSVCLNIMEHRKDAKLCRPESLIKLLQPTSERMVQSSVKRHLHFFRHADVTIGEEYIAVPATTVSTGDASMERMPSILERNADRLENAIIAYEALLGPDRNQRADVLVPLAALSLGCLRINDAFKYSQEALHLYRLNQRPLQASVAGMWVGLSHFASNKMGKALQCWREATQLACLAVGYEHPQVAVLLNNIGVLHFETGDIHGSIRALEESMELQRALLKGQTINCMEGALFQLATTMGNISMALARAGKHDTAIAILDESRSIYASLRGTEDLQAIATANLIRFEEERYTFDEQDDMDVLSTSDASVDSVRSATLFGNSDGIPNRRLNARISLQQEVDNHDFLLLGPMNPELTVEQRVRDTVLTWFGRHDVDDVCFVAHDHVSIDKQSLPVDLDEEFVINAELRLQQIHTQALSHLDRGEHQDALDLFRSALRSHQSKYGNVHHLVGTALHNMGMVHFFAKQYSEATTAFEQAITVRTAALGPDHPDVQASRMKLGLIRLACRDLVGAQDVFLEIQEKFLEILGYGHPQMAKIKNNLGVVAYELGDYRQAARHFELAHEYQMRIIEHTRQRDNEVAGMAIANTVCNLAFVQWKDGKELDALRLYEAALELMRKYKDDSDMRVQIVQDNIAHLSKFKEYIHSGGPCSNPAFCIFEMFEIHQKL